MTPGRPALLVLLLAVGGGSVWGCTFERRPDLDDEGGPVATTGGVLAGPETDSAVAVVEAAEAALDAVGGPADGGGRAALEGFMSPNGTLYLGGPGGSVAENGEAGWQLRESRVDVRDGIAVIFRRHRSTRAEEALARTRAGTWVLLRDETGWRILHVHRSQGRTGS